MAVMRNLSLFDKIVNELDGAMKTLLPPAKRIPTRMYPAQKLTESPLSEQEKKHCAGLMRVNHAGEVCAQALYQGQALTAKLTEVQQQMNQAAAEETDHLAWCEQRLHELNSKPSILNPIWYTGSIIIGALAGIAGDKISLGFVAETERQVTAHLKKHLQKIPEHDKKTRVILERMQDDEEHHALEAVNAGAIELPYFVKYIMTAVSKLMTKTSYYI